MSVRARGAMVVVSVFVALFCPATFSWIKPRALTPLVLAMTFLIGTTSRVEEFSACLKHPRPLLLNFLACFVLVPSVALLLGRAMGLAEGHFVGLVLVASVNGGTSSNALTLLAGGNVELSVLMTTSTTIGAVFLTPAILKLLLGAVVPIDAVGIFKSALVLVLAPISSGLLVSVWAPGCSRALRPAVPLLTPFVAVVILGSVIAKQSAQVLSSGPGLHLAVLALHVLSAALGHELSRWSGGGEKDHRTLAIELAVKNGVLARLLAAEHFADPATATSVVAYAFWSAIVMATLTAAWSALPAGRTASAAAAAGGWAAAYKA